MVCGASVGHANPPFPSYQYTKSFNRKHIIFFICIFTALAFKDNNRYDLFFTNLRNHRLRIYHCPKSVSLKLEPNVIRSHPNSKNVPKMVKKIEIKIEKMKDNHSLLIIINFH